MHIAKLTADPVDLTIGGVSYRVAKLRVRDIGYLERWMAEVVAAAEGRPITPENRPTMASRVGLLLLDSGEGTARIVHASLRQTIPDYSIQDARDLVNSISRDEAESIVAAAFPEPDDADADPEPPRPRDPNGMNWHAGILMLAEKYKWTDEHILDMPLDRFFGMCQDIADVQPKHRKRWALRFSSPEDMQREWERRMGNNPAGSSAN